MVKVKELKGYTFNVPLADNTTLYLRGSEEKKIKDESISQSLLNAETAGLVSITKVKEFVSHKREEKEKPNKEKNLGGAK